MERARGAKRGRGKIASGRIRCKSHFHAKHKYRNWTSTMIGLHTRYQDEIEETKLRSGRKANNDGMTERNL